MMSAINDDDGFMHLLRKRNYILVDESQDPEDFYRLDPKKSTAENAYDIYAALCGRDTRDTKRLYLLNGLATLCQQQQQRPAAGQCGFTVEEMLFCLSANLIHTFAQVRAASLRTIRYALVTPRDLKVFNTMQLHHLLCRSIDLLIKNDDERVQALKLVRKMLVISPQDISPALVRCLVSLAESGVEDGDNMLRACLATLCEFAVLNPTALVVCGGVTAITRNVLECHNPRIAESLCGVLLYLLEWPQTRDIAGVRLDCLAAPYCDFTYRLGIMDKNKDARELRYTSCRLALLSVLRSWTGTIEFCDPSKPSGLKAIVDALYLNQGEVRKAILDLLYELLGLPQPTWTDDYAIALQAMDPSDFQDVWLLSNGFVAMEGRSILPSLAARSPNICTHHVALQLYCFLETGLLNALVEVIVSDDTHLSVLATVLIGKIMQMMHTHLPADIVSTSPALPSLISHATLGNQNANAAISALQTYQKLLRNRPASCSLFLDSIIQAGSLVNTRLFRRDLRTQDEQLAVNNPLASYSPYSYPNRSMTSGSAGAGSSNAGGLGAPTSGFTLERTRTHLDSVSSSDESASQSSSSGRSSFRLRRLKLLPFLENYRVTGLIKESNVLNLPDSNSWDWEVVTTILRSNLIRKMDDVTVKFLKILIAYFKPSSNRFSHQDLAHGRAMPPYVTAGLDLIDWLLGSKNLESMRLLTDFFSDVSSHLLAVTTSMRAHDCLFSPQHMSNTMCQQYFLYIGRMCRVQKGISILTNTAVFEHLTNLVKNTDHVCYVKLIVSGLDYSLDSFTRNVLEMALTAAKVRTGRLYATQFLTVLLRAQIPHFEVWGIPLIIQQTRDSDRSVVLAALEVLEEASSEKYYLEEIVSYWPNLKPLGDPGRLVMARYYSLSRGLNHQKACIKEEIEYWKNGYNKRYSLMVEADTHASLTLHVRNEDGYYSRRNCNTRPIIIPPNIPAHIYGEMVQTTQGTTALRKYGDLPRLIDVISSGKCSDEAECLELKAALWAVGHASTHSNGIEYFNEIGSRIYEKIIILATKCEVNSIRATGFSVLGLISGTVAGANILFKLNWLSVRHDRSIIWPVHQPEDWMSNNYYTPVRHHYEEVPPYNYTSIEDQIDGSYYTGSYWNLLLSSSSTTKEEAHDTNTTTESSKTGGEELPTATTKPTAMSTSGSTTVAAKSKTLPEGTYMRHSKHQRSLSESKTADLLSFLAPGLAGIQAAPAVYHQHRIRYNSCTDSNTSGVSSCESVTMRGGAGGLMTGDFQQFPLSPIPSMSNLLEIPQAKASLLRRTSLLGTSYTQNAISPIDMKGYATFRSLRRHCRPVLSESATDFYDFINRSDFTSIPPFRLRKSSFGESQRRLKVRSLDRQSSLRMYTALFSEDMPVPLPTLNTPKFFAQNDSKGPCYAGICLPKNLLDLFPARNITTTYVSRDIQDQDLMDINMLTAQQQFLNDSLNNEGGDESSVISSLSDVSSVGKRSKWLGTKHGRGNCLHCSRARRNRMHLQRLEVGAGDGPSSSSTASAVASGAVLSMPVPTTTTTIIGDSNATANEQQSSGLSRKTTGHPKGASGSGGVGVGVTSSTVSTQQSSSTIQLSDISFNSPESILSEESMPDRITANILINVQRLANPVSARQSKTLLLELKQKHAGSFQDICLYSEVCRILGRSSYRMSARRFVQELFLDLNFDSFYAEPIEILRKKDKRFKVVRELRIYASLADQFHALDNNYGDALIPESTIGSETINLSTTKSAGASGGASGSSGGSGGGSSSSSVSGSGSGSIIKSHIKSQPLESVYETSCENLLLENSPRLATETNQKLPLDIERRLAASSPPLKLPLPLKHWNYKKGPSSKELNVSESDTNNQAINLQLVYSGSDTKKKYFWKDGPSSFECGGNDGGGGSGSGNDETNEITILRRRALSSCSVYTIMKNRQSPDGGDVSVVTSTPHHSNTTASMATTSTPISAARRSIRRSSYTLDDSLIFRQNKFPINDRSNISCRAEAAVGLTTFATERNKLMLAGGEADDGNDITAMPVDYLSTSSTSCKEMDSTIFRLNNDSIAPLNIPTMLWRHLYCEKRLQASKSETLLTNPTGTTITTMTAATPTITSTAGDGLLVAESVSGGGGVGGGNAVAVGIVSQRRSWTPSATGKTTSVTGKTISASGKTTSVTGKTISASASKTTSTGKRDKATAIINFKDYDVSGGNNNNNSNNNSNRGSSDDSLKRRPT